MKNKCRKKTAVLLVISLLCALLTAGCGSSKEPDRAGSSEEYEEQIRLMQEEIDTLKAELAQYTGQPETEPPAENTADTQNPESVPEETTPVEAGTETATEEQPEEATPDRLQIVVFGDSIWDSSRDETGIAYLVSQYMDADVYNCAIGGTRASMKEGAPTEDYENWESTSLSGMVNAAIGFVDPEIFLEGYVAGGVFRNIDFSKTDYFIIAYGLNDYFSGAVLNAPTSNSWDTHGYGGALRMAVDRLRTHYPNAQFLLISPTYCQFWKDGVMYTDSNMRDFGGGTLTDYANVCRNVAETQNTLFIDAYSTMGINGYTAEEYLEDGIHLTAAGRELYAKAVSSCLKYGKPGEVSGNSVHY